MVAVNERFPMTSRPTVYNTLQLAEGRGADQRGVFEGGRDPLRSNTSDGAMFVCRRCGRVEDIDTGSVGEIVPWPE
jgi:Fe2+ or Zn2+ uptake regulation protein